jgi:hypothetical protein
MSGFVARVVPILLVALVATGFSGMGTVRYIGSPIVERAIRGVGTITQESAS